MTRIGFVGLGAMGHPMAACLLRKGYEVLSFAHQRRANLEDLCKQGARDVGSVDALIGEVDFIVSMLPTGREVLGLSRAILEARHHPDLTLIDMSTISPVDAKAAACNLKSVGGHFLDAPVSGGPFKAKDGSLAIFVGAEEKDYENSLSILKTMGIPRLIGPVGSGQVVKLVNNSIIAAGMVGLVEGMELGKAAGLDPVELREILLNASSASFLMQTWIPKNYLKDDFTEGFAMKLMHKDLGCAMDLARDLNLPMPITSLAWQMFRQGISQGYGEMDYSAVAKLLNRQEEGLDG